MDRKIDHRHVEGVIRLQRGCGQCGDAQSADPHDPQGIERQCPALTAIARLRNLLESVPYSILAIPLRLAVATVFWNSGTTKLASWDTTLALFADEYRVPVLPPEIAATMAASIELTTPVLLLLGFLTRPAAVVLLGMTTVIEVFVYPQAWPTHIQWVAMLLVLLCRGAGGFSLDYLVERRLGLPPR